MNRYLPISALALLASCAAAYAQTTPTAYVNAHILPVSGSPIEHGAILIQGGKIKAIGSNIAIPAGAARIDLHGATVIPGLVDASSSLFLTEETLTGAGTADQNVLDGLDPFDKSAIKVLSRGVTTVYVSPGSRGGMGAVVKLQDASQGQAQTGAAVFETPLKSKAGVHFSLGLASGGKSSSIDRIASYEALRATFIGAQQYVKAQARAEQAKKAAAARPAESETEATFVEEPVQQPGESNDDFAQRQRGQRRGGPGRPGGAAAPRAQPSQEVLALALKGDIPVRIEAHRVDDILNAIRLADEFKFKLVLEAPTEAASVMPEIKAHHAAVIWTVAPEGAPLLDTAGYNPRSVASFESTGVWLAISGRSNSGLASRFLLEDAAEAAGSGLGQLAALRAVTLGPAEILGVADHVGSLQVGKDADIVVLSGSPWSAETVVRRVIVNGVQMLGTGVR